MPVANRHGAFQQLYFGAALSGPQDTQDLTSSLPARMSAEMDNHAFVLLFSEDRP